MLGISRYKVELLFSAFWGIPVAIAIRLLKPLIHIRICRIYSERVGHFVMDSAEQIVKFSFKNPKEVRLFYFGDTSNQQWEKMVRRTIRIQGNWIKGISDWNRILPFSKNFTLPSSSTGSRDLHGLLLKHDARLSFTDSENLEATSWLQSKGVKPDEKYICLHVRDSTYLEVHNPQNINPEIMMHDDHRNADIKSMLLAIEWLTNNDIWVIRMGKSVSNPLPTCLPRVIDYAFDPNRSDSLDIWLYANCLGSITTVSGIDSVGIVYRKPQLHFNMLPLGHLHAYLNCLTVPKNLFWRESGIELTLAEYLDNDFTRAPEYMEAGISIKDLTNEEILQAVIEFYERLMGVWMDSEESKSLQDRFWTKLADSKNFLDLQPWRHPESRIGHAWLASKEEKFFGD